MQRPKTPSIRKFIAIGIFFLLIPLIAAPSILNKSILPGFDIFTQNEREGSVESTIFMTISRENFPKSASFISTPLIIDALASGVDAHNWTWALSENWCTGNGTLEFPYTFANYQFSGLNDSSIFQILNSVANVLIINCSFSFDNGTEYFFSGIASSNINFRNCTFSDGYGGIWIQTGSYPMVDACQFTNLSTNGIYFDSSQNGLINASVFVNCSQGIFTDGTITDHTVENNNFINCNAGISLNSNSNELVGNNLTEGTIGIYLDRAKNNLFSGNYITAMETAISLYDRSNSNQLTANTITDVTTGIKIRTDCLDVSVVSNNFSQIAGTALQILDNSHQAQIEGNFYNNSQVAINCSYSDEISISGEEILNCSVGIVVDFSTLAMITDLYITSSTEVAILLQNSTACNITTSRIEASLNYGVMLNGSTGNFLYSNYFFDNLHPAQNNDLLNFWNSSSQGNFWSDYAGEDVNLDGFGDTPYSIFGTNSTADYLPIVNYAPRMQNAPFSQIYQDSEIASPFEWTISDDFVLTPLYELRVNDLLLQTASWESDTPLLLDKNALVSGINTIEFRFTDGLTDWVTNTTEIILNYDPTLVADPEDLLFSDDSTDNTITWEIADDFVLMALFHVLVDGEVYLENQSWVPGMALQVTLNGYAIGDHNLSLEVVDGAGGSLFRFYDIFVYNNPNFVLSPSSDLEFICGSNSTVLTWQIADLNMSIGTYFVYLNDSLIVFNETWSDGDTLTVDLTYLGPFTFIVRLECFDGLGGSISDEVAVRFVMDLDDSASTDDSDDTSGTDDDDATDDSSDSDPDDTPITFGESFQYGGWAFLLMGSAFGVGGTIASPKIIRFLKSRKGSKPSP